MDLSETGNLPYGSPFLYQRPEVLSAPRHSGLRLLPGEHFGFASHAHLVPVCAEESLELARSHPIVFIGERATPVVVTALRRGSNLFVSPDGAWRKGHRPPLYLRRHPFLPGPADEVERWPLSVDMASNRVVSEEAADGVAETALPFFIGGQPSPLFVTARMLCISFNSRWQSTMKATASIAFAGLLVDQAKRLRDIDGSTLVVGGFKVVDEAAFKALPERYMLTLHRSGALPLIYAHLASMGAWSVLQSLEQHTLDQPGPGIGYSAGAVSGVGV